MKRRVMWFTAVGIGSLLIWAAASTSRAGYESPKYEVLEKAGQFELRKYPRMKVVATPMAADSKGNRDSGFMRLFKYISGENEADQKIAMTTPVLVREEKKADPGAMMFVLPVEVAEAGGPAPNAGSVDLKTVNGGSYAALRFKGYRSEVKQDAALARLREILKEKKIKAAGEPMFAFYDPPWTPEFLRRNEVLIPVALKD